MQTTDLPDFQVVEEATRAACEVGSELGRFAGSTGIRFVDVEHALRTAFVAGAASRLEREGVSATVARLSVATGLPRSVVEQALAATRDEAAVRGEEAINEDGFFSGLELLCSLWSTDSRFTAVYGVPRDLTVRRAPDVYDTLEDLAAIALPGVQFDRVLRALRELSLVQLSEERSRARLIGHTVVVGNREARAISRYGRLVAGLMRTLRANYDDAGEPSSSKPWELTLSTDRPIARSQIDAFLELVNRAAGAWLSGLEVEQQAYVPARGQVGSRFAVCCFVSEDDPHARNVSARTPRASAFSDRLPFVRAMVTAHRLDPDGYQRFRREVSESCDRWLLTLDAEQKSMFAAPGEDGVALKVTCYLFPVAGSEGRTDEQSDIDLVEAVVRHRIRA